MANQQDLETEAQFLKRIISPFSSEKFIDNFTPKWLLLQWHITDRCNLRCLHCYQPEYADRNISEKQQLYILSQYVHLLKKWNIKGHINITGGEPLISDHLLFITEEISRYKDLASYAILSNGTLVTNEIAKQLKKSGCSFFQISIEGSKAFHDKIRGEGNFEKCMDALAILKRQRIQTMVSFTASKINAGSFAEVVSICKRKGVNVLWTDRYLPLGRGKGMQDELLQPTEVETFFEQLYQWHQTLRKSWFNKTELRIHRALNFLVAEKHGCNCYQPYKCTAGRSLITILPNGDMLPCRRMPVVVGNVLETSMEDIYENSVLFRMLRKNNVPYPGCQKCSHWEVCNGGLRCLSYAYYRNPFVADPQCFKIHTSLPNII